MNKVRAAVLVVFLFISLPGQAAHDRTFFWQVKNKQATVYLLGSIHVARDDFYPLRKEIQNAFENSNQLVVEVDMSAVKPEEIKAYLSEKGVLEQGKTIKDVLSREVYQQLEKTTEELGVPFKFIETLKPGMIMMTLTTARLEQMGLSHLQGIDLYFIEQANRQSKKIIPLETIEGQLGLLMDMPMGDLLIRETLREIKESLTEIEKLTNLWKEGNEEDITRFLFDDVLTQSPELLPVYNVLFYERNNRMTEKIRKLLKQKGTSFVVVGAGHMVGDRGIVQQLKESGFTVLRK